jgi:selenocysteine-specific elongation factor
VLTASPVTGAGIDAVRQALVALRDRVVGSGDSGISMLGSRLAVDRVFAVKGRGVVVTGTLRGRSLTRAASLRLVPGEGLVRVREVQVHGAAVDGAGPGRTALNLAGVESGDLRRGLVLTDDPAVTASARLLVRLAAPLPDRARARLHLGTAATDVSVGRSGRDSLDLSDGSVAAILRLAGPLGVAAGDRLVLRRAAGADRIVGGMVLDTTPPHGISRRRQTWDRVERLAASVIAGDARAVSAARLDLHGALEPDDGASGPVAVASDVVEAVKAAVLAGVGAGTSLTAVRDVAARALRRLVTIGRPAAAIAATALVDRFVTDGALVRDGASVRRPGTEPIAPAADPDLASAMDRLEHALAVPAPPALAEAARTAGCASSGIRDLERSGRIVVLEPDLAYASSTYREITAQALTLAAAAPVTPAALRDATGTSRKYVMAILADLDRQGILRRTPDGHVRGPRAPVAAQTDR